MAEWSIAAVLKTVEGQTSGGSNPSLSAVIVIKPLSSKSFVILRETRGQDRGLLFNRLIQYVEIE
jgi:hypothetical protein